MDIKQFALAVHNFAFGTNWDDEDIVSAMGFEMIVEKMKKDEKELKEKYEEGVKHVLTLTEEIKELKEEVAELWLDNGSLGRQDKELKQERDNLREEVAKLKEVAAKNFQRQITMTLMGTTPASDKDEELKELKQHNLFLMAECCAGGWNARDNDPQEFADSVKEYFMEYQEHDKIENVEELYEEWKEWANVD